MIIIYITLGSNNVRNHHHHQRNINPDSPEQSKVKLVQPTAEIRGAITKSNDLE